MQKIQFIVIILGLAIGSAGQQKKLDSIQRLIASATSDTARIVLLDLLSDVYRENRKVDSCIFARKQALALNEKTNFSLLLQCWQTAGIDYMLFETGNYVESLSYALRHLALSEALNDTLQKGSAHLVFGHNYRDLAYYREALKHYFNAAELFKAYHEGRGNPEDNHYTYGSIAQVYLKINQPDSALYFTAKANEQALSTGDSGVILLASRLFGDIYHAMDEDEVALKYYRQYLPDYIKYNEVNRDLGFVLNGMAAIFRKRNQRDSALSYATRAFNNARQYHDLENIYTAANTLHALYQDNDEHEAFNYFKIAVAAKDSIASVDKLRQVQLLAFNEQVQEREKKELADRAKAKTRVLLFFATMLTAIASILTWNRIRQLRLKYKLLLEQKETEKLKAKYEKELAELEAKALRAQMNPHFIFNCLNSIKSLMQERSIDKGIVYLTTFSKLIRTIFNNAEKREITLFDEIETCRLYLQLEAMRFDQKLSYSVEIDDRVDLKSLYVPALILQPFIENAIWHGIIPKHNGGTVRLVVSKDGSQIKIIVDDDGIGRDASRQTKSGKEIFHHSKGINLTQSRIDLDNLLKHRNASLEMVDKHHNNETGTTIILTIPVES